MECNTYFESFGLIIIEMWPKYITLKRCLVSWSTCQFSNVGYIKLCYDQIWSQTLSSIIFYNIKT